MYKKSMNVVSRVAQVSSAIALAWVSTAGVAAAGSPAALASRASADD